MSLIKEEIQEKYEDCQVLAELHTDLSEMYLIATAPENDNFNKFVFVWGDYVANVWEEEYELLSTATARMAQLIYINERDPEGEIVGCGKHGDEFTTAWTTFVKDTTVVVDYEGAK